MLSYIQSTKTIEKQGVLTQVSRPYAIILILSNIEHQWTHCASYRKRAKQIFETYENNDGAWQASCGSQKNEIPEIPISVQTLMICISDGLPPIGPFFLDEPEKQDNVSPLPDTMTGVSLTKLPLKHIILNSAIIV